MFLGRIDELRDRALFSLLYGSGLRVGEALSLDIEHLLADRTFVVIGKGGVERTGYLTEETARVLRRYLRGRAKLGPVFCSRQGRLGYPRVHQLFNDIQMACLESVRRSTRFAIRSDQRLRVQLTLWCCGISWGTRACERHSGMRK